jgi:hypothetical protein
MRVEFVELPALIFGEPQPLAGEWRKHGGRPLRPGTEASRAFRPVAAAVGWPRALSVNVAAIGDTLASPASVSRAAIGSRAVALGGACRSSIRDSAIGVGAAIARFDASGAPSGRAGGTAPPRSQLVVGELAVAVSIQRLQRISGGLKLLGGNDAVVIFVQNFKQWPMQRRS